MEVRIGVQHASRELTVDSGESAEQIGKLVSEAVGNDGILTLTDTKGRTLLVPAARLAYVEIGTSVSGQVGFRS